jgi:hypothetical protein
MIETLIDSALRSIALASIVWVGLRVLRTRSSHLQLMAWTFVLVASLLMPVTTQLVAVVVPPAPIMERGVEEVLPLFVDPSESRGVKASFAQADERSPSTNFDPAVPPVGRFGEGLAFFAPLAYGAVVCVFLLRIVMGLSLTMALARRAQPLRQYAPGYEIRVSPEISSPATFGRIILLPVDYADWAEPKRLAVLAHEIAHARRGDFYVQIAAMFNRAIFWFSPLSWWLQRRLSELAEAASDDAALAYVEDRSLYAEILLEFSGGAPMSFAVSMARPPTVRARIERILAESDLPKLLTLRGRVFLLAALSPIAVFAASPLAASAPPAEEAALATPSGSATDADRAVQPVNPPQLANLAPNASEAEPALPTNDFSRTAALSPELDANETKRSPSAGNNRDISSAYIGPALPTGTDPGATRVSPHIVASPKSVRNKTEAAYVEPSPAKAAELQPVRTAAAPAVGRPDICRLRHWDDVDASGQKGFFICAAFDRQYAAIQPVGRR